MGGGGRGEGGGGGGMQVSLGSSHSLALGKISQKRVHFQFD